MQSINISDLPEPVARAIVAMIEAVRRRMRERQKPARPGPLPTRPGRVIGRLTREEIYDDRA